MSVPAGHGLWRAAAAGAVLAGYALASHWLMLHVPGAPATVALLFGPLVLAAAALGWRRRHALTLAACAALMAVLVGVVLRGGVQDVQRLYVLQHGGIHLVLAWTFGMSLRRFETPLVTLMACGVHERLGLAFTPALERYTRNLTRVWVGYFLGMTAVSFLLYGLAPWDWWPLFCTVLTPLALAAMFVGEYVWRYRRHPDFPRVSMRVAFDAYQRSQHGARP